ncbi:MAG: adenosylmethionine decarboxylase [Mycoplasmatales bacterium]
MKISMLGRHLLIEYYNCNEQILKDYKKVEYHLNEAAKLSGATIVNSVFHHFNPYGVSGAVIIQESHLTIHTWPEYQYAAVDIFTCGDHVDPWKAFEYLEKVFEAQNVESSEEPRGIIEKINKFNNKNDKI